MDYRIPVHEIRNGSVIATVWQCEPRFTHRYCVTFGRSYHLADDWKSSRCFTPAELQQVAVVAAMASTWIADRRDGAHSPQMAVEREPSFGPSSSYTEE